MSDLGCCLCGSRPAQRRGMELHLSQWREGRRIWREVDGMLPICEACLAGFFTELPRSPLPFFVLIGALMLLLQGYWASGSIVLAFGLLGTFFSLSRPTRQALFRRVQQQALRYSSVPVSGFEAGEIVEIVLDRRISLCFDAKALPQAKRLQ